MNVNKKEVVKDACNFVTSTVRAIAESLSFEVGVLWADGWVLTGFHGHLRMVLRWPLSRGPQKQTFTFECQNFGVNDL